MTDAESKKGKPPTPPGQLLTETNINTLFDSVIAAVYDVDAVVPGASTDGVTHSFVFGDIESIRKNVFTMCSQLADEFMYSKSNANNGSSFLNIGHNKDGELWTDNPDVMERLVAMGVALGIVRFTSLRQNWTRLPGGVPNCVVLDI